MLYVATGRALFVAGGLALFVGGAVPALIFGVAFGNLFQGVPFQFDDYLVSTYTGSFWQLLNPFALLAGGQQFVVNLAGAKNDQKSFDR